MRVSVEREQFWEDDGVKVVFRLREQSGEHVDRWLPDENPDPEGPLDRGGFDTWADAQGFALGVDRERALHGLLTETVEEIDFERGQLDRYGASPRNLESFDAAQLRKLDTARQLDFNRLLFNGSPKIEHRRLRSA
jgi:hypothetical protein